MKTWPTSILSLWFLLTSLALIPSLAAPRKQAEPAAKNAPKQSSHVVMERIYTTDMEALIRSQETRKQFYGNCLPAATWVEVRRLYGPADKIEIEAQVAVD